MSGRTPRRRLAGIAASVIVAVLIAAPADATDKMPPLALEATIQLPNTSGRIDHLAVDLKRKRLFVAELGNGSVDVVDLGGRKVTNRLAGLKEPQGVAYVPRADLLAVASGGDGTVRFFNGSDFTARGVVTPGQDADNLRLDSRDGNVVVGYGSGGLAIIDPVSAAKLRDIPLPDHPEGFQLAADGRAYVNVPGAHLIAVVDLDAGKMIGNWPTPNLSANFPMALGDGNSIAVVFRSPSKMVQIDRSNGRTATANTTCGDADDVFFDTQRQRYYVSCGAGSIAVFQMMGGSVVALQPVTTSSGARTSLFVPEFDRLFVAVRAGLLGSDASIRIYRPQS